MKRIVIACALLVAFATPALADGINLSPLVDALTPIFAGVVNAFLLALATWGFALFKSKTGIDLDQGHRDAFVRALQNQAASLIADGAVRMRGTQVQVDSTYLARAVNDALASVPAAIDHFGITPEVVARRIADMIPQVPAGAQMIASAHAAAAARVANATAR